MKHNKPINDVNSISLNAFDEVNDVGLSDVTLGATQNLLQGQCHQLND
ncbi:hypothetical protein AN944_00658 [Shewanella sp. P1-14-1]|nr:hypothetical protein AN944_00658 [Shewanella sp. P1-14-1]